MTLDEAIKQTEERADLCEYEASRYDMSDSYENYVACQEGKCAKEQRQIAEWLKELKQLKEQIRWIPVSERLPEVGDTYIVSGRMKYDFEKEYTYFTDCAEYLPSNIGGADWGTWTDWYEGQQEYEILAWKPLPEPYEENK